MCPCIDITQPPAHVNKIKVQCNKYVTMGDMYT